MLWVFDFVSTSLLGISVFIFRNARMLSREKKKKKKRITQVECWDGLPGKMVSTDDAIVLEFIQC